jgi:hypothetical protein
MSGPFRFNQEEAKSPLYCALQSNPRVTTQLICNSDRSASPFSAGQPVNFKTNVNRAKTKKWVTAKKNAYDGDDWGDYDEYDEYGVEPTAPAPAQRYYAGAQQPQRTYTDRSFTEPHPQGPPGPARRNSFEAGQETRAFSASIPPPQHGYDQQQPPYAEPQRQTSGADSDLGHEPQDRRDFTPSAMPTPLQTRISAVPSDVGASASSPQYPPRKSSISQKDAPFAASPRSRTGSHSDKPLPFVRPADIYKRMEEERERERRASLDSSRPSLDSPSSRPKDDLNSPTSDGGRMLQPLETVAERKSEYLPDFDSAFTEQGKPQTLGSHAPAVSPPNDLGLRSVVDQAFTRTDDSRSIPPTPISKDSDSGMFRTNTGSTSGISPIMSRVPSAATAAMKRSQVEGEGSTPAIAEEPSDTAASVPQPTHPFLHGSAQATAPKAFPDHSRNISSSSLPRSGLATPTRGDSPARSPVIAPQKDLPEPKAAQIGLSSPDREHAMEGGLHGPSAAYATREADIATAVKSGDGGAAPKLGAAEKESQDAFLESHVAQSPIEDAFPRSRSESPSKGRVQALAGKFGDVASSRRGSTQSNRSRNSVQSWERSQDNSRAASPTKGSPGKPSSPIKEFRPHLPGQWESYATTVPTPMDQSERDRSLGFEDDKDSTSLEKADLTPTTAKRPVNEVTPDSPSDPLSALKSAGAAMAQSFRTTVGLDDGPSNSQTQHGDHLEGLSHGDMYKPRPLQLERAESAMSSIPPTPPAKDTPTNEYPPQLSPKDADSSTPTQQRRPDFFPQLSTAPSADDQESDRLRKEIVASLTPVTTIDPRRTSLQPASPGTNRASSILPAEYDSYWADDGNASPRPSQDVERSMPAAIAAPKISQAEEIAQPSLLNRFSWENNNLQLAKPDGLEKALPLPVPEPVKTSHEDTINKALPLPVPEPVKPSHIDTIPPPTVERAAEDEREQWSEGLPDPYFGPGHTFTVTKPDPLTETEISTQSPTSHIDHSSLTSPTREQTRSPGLHVVNSAINPEAVDLPPRLSADFNAPADNNQDDTKALQKELNLVQQELDQTVPNPTHSASASASAPAPVPESAPSVPAHDPVAMSPTSGKPLGAREIATINSPAERIATYNQTRQHWATHDHGLEGWLSSALEANPDLTSQIPSVRRPSTGTVRHKHTASLSLLGKLGGSSAHQPLSPDQQQQSSSTQAPVGEGSPTTAFDRKVASRQLEAKGKDLLHTANVLSGKGLTSAKGLFAKGKSRFGREKVEK